MEKLSNNQLIYRAYLASPLWHTKRMEALAFYGPKCRRCGEYGTDVHHKTYARVGGNELMEDFEILCRDCHEAHHKACRKNPSNKRGKSKGIHRRAIYSSLSKSMKDRLCSEYGIPAGQLFATICYGSNDLVVRNALKLLGMDYVFNSRPSKTRGKKRNGKWLQI